jgi:asparagine synthetase A
MKQYKNFLAMLSSEFSMYLIEHHKIIPENALIIFEVGGEDDFNDWHRTLSMKNREPKQPVVVVQLKKWRRHSAIDKITMQKAVA